MNRETRTIHWDEDLHIEAYCLQGIVQKFPHHFHEEYVIGYVEGGQRNLNCKSSQYIVNVGDLIIFNPRDPHSCAPLGDTLLDWRCINIKPAIMRDTMYEITGKRCLPYFKQSVIVQSELVLSLRELHGMLLHEEQDFRKEEAYLLLMEQLITMYAEPIDEDAADESSIKTQAVCTYLEQHYASSISLDELSAYVGLSKYYLLRTFTRYEGITPYQYLQTIRIDRAKKLLEQGISPIDAAHQTGFSDQSHFTNQFKQFIGLTPRQYRDIFR